RVSGGILNHEVEGRTRDRELTGGARRAATREGKPCDHRSAASQAVRDVDMIAGREEKLALESGPTGRTDRTSLTGRTGDDKRAPRGPVALVKAEATGRENARHVRGSEKELRAHSGQVLRAGTVRARVQVLDLLGATRCAVTHPEFLARP